MQATVANEKSATATQLGSLKSAIDGTKADLSAYQKTQATKDAAQTAELTSAKSQIGDNKAAIAAIRSTKADKTEVVSMARTGLQSEWRSDVNAAKTAAATDAQTKADAAKQAAITAAETAATAKANAAKAAAVAESAQTAQSKADAAKAAAIADAATKDAVLKQQVAADATAKADAAKAEAVRLNNATNAKITALEQTVSNQNSATASQISTLTAKVDNVQVGGRNLAIAARFEHGKWVSEVNGAINIHGQHRLSGLIAVQYNTQYVVSTNKLLRNVRVAWFDGEQQFISGILKLNADNGWVLTAPENAAFARFSYDFIISQTQNVQFERGNIRTDYEAAPEDLAAETAAVAAELSEHKTAQVIKDAAQTQQIQAAVSKIGDNKAAIDSMRSTKADKTEVSSLARTTLQSEWQTAATNAANAAKSAAATAVQAKADAAKNAAIAEAQRLNIATNAKITALETTVSNQNSATAQQISSLNAQFHIADTRDDNQPPSWYWRNHPKQNVREFKKLVVIGVSGSGQYGMMETAVIWGDPSGGKIEQRVTDQNGKSWRRQSNVAYTWGNGRYDFTRDEWAAWVADETVLGAQAKADAVREIAEATQRALQATQAELTTHKSAQASKDTTQTAEIQAAVSKIGDNKAAIDSIRNTKADKTEVVSMARTGLQSEWQTAANTAESRAKTAAATDAQTKADAAKQAAITAAETAATAKANAAKAAAVAESAQTAQSKADAAKAAAIADAATKDAVLKQQVAADATAKADAAKAEAVRLNNATNAKITALEQTVSNQNSATTSQFNKLRAEIGGKVSAPDKTVLDLTTLDSETWYPIVFSAIGVVEPASFRVSQELGNRGHSPTWASHTTNSFSLICEWTANGHGWGAIAIERVINTFTFNFVRDGKSPVLKIGQMGRSNREYVYLRGGAKYDVFTPDGVTATLVITSLSVANETVEPMVYNVDFVPRADLKQLSADISAERQARVTANTAQTTEINTAKSQIAQNTAQISSLKTTFASEKNTTASQINSLNSKMGMAEANIRTTQTTTAELSGKVQAMYTLKTEVVSGGRKVVSGLSMGVDGRGESQFNVHANKFAVWDGGSMKPMFAMVTVNGKTQAALSGDLLADGLIHGRHIAAGQTIQAPVIKGGSLNIGDGRFSVDAQGEVVIKSHHENKGLKLTSKNLIVYDDYGNVQIVLGEMI